MWVDTGLKLMLPWLAQEAGGTELLIPWNTNFTFGCHWLSGQVVEPEPKTVTGWLIAVATA